MSFLPVAYQICHEDQIFNIVAGPKVVLTLHTNDQKTSKGFRLEYKGSCKF